VLLIADVPPLPVLVVVEPSTVDEQPGAMADATIVAIATIAR
jgi:hypothetical protein